MKELAQRVRAQVACAAEQQLDFLRRLVALETPTQAPVRTRQGLQLLAGHLQASGFRCRILTGKCSGGQLLAIPRVRQRGQSLQLLIGHVDTVWPCGTLAHMPLVLEGDRLKGPGVFDMKAGLCNALFALRTLQVLQLQPALTPVVFINTDEETGSEDSLLRLCRLARIAQRAYVMEPALDMTGKLKTARKGVGQYVITAHGIAAHAGLNPEGGASAILELAHVVQRLFALNDQAKGVSINVGKIDGGLGANVVAPRSSCEVDVRVPTAAQGVLIDQAIRGLRSVTPGVRLGITGGLRRPPLERSPPSRKLYRYAQAVGRALGFELDEGIAGGGSDGNHSSQYTATLDGLGAVGDGAHAQHEFVFVDQLFERTALLGLLVLAPCLTDQQEERSCKVSCARR